MLRCTSITTSTSRRIRVGSTVWKRTKAHTTTTTKQDAAQASALNYYRQKQKPLFGGWWRRSSRKNKTTTQAQRNQNTAWYMLSIAIGTLGASYAAVPLYKVFCQTTGFGGTTQRVWSEEKAANTGVMEEYLSQAMGFVWNKTKGTKVHTWTDEDAIQRLRQLKPVPNAQLITVRFDTTVPDNIPWSFVPVVLDVRVVPGETALSFFRVTNHSDKAITGVATYNVHPPKVGAYFQKIQCFCFEEQRLLPGETVDMPVFFFIDPDILNDPGISYCKSVTLSYTFFKTDEDDDDDDDDD